MRNREREGEIEREGRIRRLAIAYQATSSSDLHHVSLLFTGDQEEERKAPTNRLHLDSGKTVEERERSEEKGRKRRAGRLGNRDFPTDLVGEEGKGTSVGPHSRVIHLGMRRQERERERRVRERRESIRRREDLLISSCLAPKCLYHSDRE